ncbi:MAG: quinone-dependent dihydroorotate dehydrogenase [Geitlerinemataceae cyanobacterium]
MDLYQSFVRPLFFSGLKADPEWIHNRFVGTVAALAQRSEQPGYGWLCDRLYDSYDFRDPRLEQTLWGIRFRNPLGLAAGFDKNGAVGQLWGGFGFGFAELGTATWHAQPGNPQPRLFRLTADLASLNRMGFNNRGAVAMAKNLEIVAHAPESSPDRAIAIGVNLGKSKVTDLDEAAEDYRQSFEVLQGYGDYFVVNVSSPNTPGLRSLQDPDRLAKIFETLQTQNADDRRTPKPILVKIAPDLEWDAIDDVVRLAQQFELAGIIATNTTIARDGLNTQTLSTGNPVTDEAGGLAGAPLRARSTETIRHIYRTTGGALPIIGVGGIFTAEDAWEKITAGASLLQSYTGWVYEGPAMAKRISRGLLDRLEEHGLDRIDKAIGLDHH